MSRRSPNRLRSTLSGEGFELEVAGTLEACPDLVRPNRSRRHAHPARSVLGETADSRAILSVIDASSGIPKEEQARVTDHFYRGKETPAGGSGLGLAIARQLVEKCGGSLIVGDAEGGGTRVEIRLQRASQERASEQERT
jgi:signal transduction histidine kinase